ncbi:MAG TPA: HEAT repeat domain-containing protein [Kofleriaceae bacterium]|nr:HEAT repeat domain-containing protein [Kofleriaceae bacterium]
MLAIAAVATTAGAQPAGKAPAKPPAAKKPSPLAGDVAALLGTDVEAAARAATTLGGSPSPAAHDALLDALALGLPPAVAVPAFAALVQHPAPPDVTALRRYAGHRDPAVRSAALGALAGYPDPAARRAIVGGLSDRVPAVRAAAAAAAGKGRVRDAVEPLLALLALGEEAAARGLAQMADPDLARKIADQYGKVPDASLALCLGFVLKRADFGPDPARVEIVRALSKIQDRAAYAALSEYLEQSPKTPARPSRQEAQMIVDARAGGAR